MKSALISILATPRCQLAENPLWHSAKGCLYWTDIPAGRMHELETATGAVRTIYEGEPVGGFTFQANGDFLLFRVTDIALLRPDGTITPVRKFSDDGMQRFNDVIADPQGRVFAGTYGENPKCGLYRVDLDGTVTKLFTGSGCSNGMGFSPDLKIFYWTCSTTRRILQFDYDAADGQLRNQTIFYQAASGGGLPDGMCIDAEGCIWSAQWGGAAVLRHDRHGKVIEHIPLPALNVTSLCFGGTKLDELYITSAVEKGKQDEGGHLFRIPARVSGLPEFTSRLQIGE